LSIAVMAEKDILALKMEDALKFLTCNTHLGTQNVDFQMESYVYKRRPDGIHILNLKKTWEKLVLAARAIAAIEDPAEVFVISSRPYGQRAVLKFAVNTGATPIAGRFTPGTFTNQIQKAFREPRLLVVSDPRTDQQPIREASYVNIPVIAFCNTDSPLRFVDVAVPCNNKAAHSIGLMWWLLAREVLRIRGKLGRDKPWSVMVDLFFYRDPEEIEKEEQAAIAPVAAKEQQSNYVQDWVATGNEGGYPHNIVEDVKDWAAEPMPENFTSGQQWTSTTVQDEWSGPAAGAAPAANQEQWGGGGDGQNW